MCELTAKLRSYNPTSGYSRWMRKAADEIDENRDAMKVAARTITELCQAFDVPLPEDTLKRLISHD